MFLFLLPHPVTTYTKTILPEDKIYVACLDHLNQQYGEVWQLYSSSFYTQQSPALVLLDLTFLSCFDELQGHKTMPILKIHIFVAMAI
jgi:hypothetical protein